MASSGCCRTKNSGNHLQIDDSFFADVVQAGGWDCSSVCCHDEHLTRFERLLAQADSIKPKIVRSALAESARAARARSDPVTSQQRTIAEVSAGVSAVMLLAYVVWILARAQASGVKRLYFLARDGQILLKMARKIIRHSGLDLDARYLFVSRQSLHLPGIQDLSEDDIKSLGFHTDQTVGEILSRLGLSGDPSALKLLADAGFKSPLAKLTAQQISDLASTLRSGHLEHVIRNATRQRAVLVDYLRQEGFFTEEKIGIVDLGWKGGLQRSLYAAVQSHDPTFVNRVHGFYFRLLSRPAGVGTLESYVNEGRAASLAPFIRASLFEAICAAQHGTTISHEREANGTARPVRAPYAENDPASVWGVGLQHDIIKAFTDEVLANLGIAGQNILELGSDLTEASFLVLRAFISHPTRKEAEAMGSFPHAPSQFHREFSEIAPRLRLDQLPLALTSKNNTVVSEWIEGSIARSFPGPIASLLLAVLAPIRRSPLYPSNKRL